MLRRATSHRTGNLGAVNLVPTRWYTPLLMPSTIAFVLMAIGLYLLWRKWLRRVPSSRMPAGCWLTIGGIVMLYLCCTPIVATWLALSLERQAGSGVVEALPKADVIVVLGGGQAAYMHPDGSVELFAHNGPDRFERALRAFKAGKATCIAFGGGEAPVPGKPNFADWMASQAIERGVPPSAIIVGPAARYTQDEGEGLVQRLRERGIERVILCTSAYHMPRARAIYESLGMVVSPLPADFDTRGEAEQFEWSMLLPRGVALAQTECCVKEWIGLFVARMRGRSG